MDTRKCTRCKVDKPLSEYYVYRFGPRIGKPLSGKCNACNKALRMENIDSFKLYSQTYRNSNRQKVIDCNKNWKVNNPERVKELNKKWELAHRKNRTASRANRRKTDPLYNTACAARKVVTNAIKRMGYEKNSKTEAILGCSFEAFKQYVERLFKPGMTWLNHGEWHLDHVIPICIARTEEELLDLNHYTNLQPLWAKENLEKCDKYVWIPTVLNPEKMVENAVNAQLSV